MTSLTLLHGLGADRRAFQRFARLLPEQWQVEALDLLGHGDAPKPERGYSLDDHAAYVAQQLGAATEPQDRPVLAGHSYGASTAVAVAALHPSLVAGIVLLDPVVRLDAEDVGSRTARMIDARLRGTLSTVVPELFPDASPALQAWTIETWSKMAAGVLHDLDGDWMRFARHVRCRVAIVHGEPEQGGAGDLAADWFDEPLVFRIAGAGHYLHATHARETADAVMQAARSMSS